MIDVSAPLPKFSTRQKIKLGSIGIFTWKIQTHLTNEELLLLLSLSESLPNGATVVEIGSYIGASSLVIAKGLKADSVIYCVDTWQNDAMTEGSIDTFSTFSQNTRSVAKRIKPIRAMSADAAKDFTSKIHFLFVDGDHSYEGAKTDWDSWQKKLLPGASVAFHDYGWAEGVKRVVHEDVMPLLQWHKSSPNLFWGKLK